MLIGFVLREDLIFSSELDEPFVLLNIDDSVAVGVNAAAAAFVLLLLLVLF